MNDKPKNRFATNGWGQGPLKYLAVALAAPAAFHPSDRCQQDGRDPLECAPASMARQQEHGEHGRHAPDPTRELRITVATTGTTSAGAAFTFNSRFTPYL